MAKNRKNQNVTEQSNIASEPTSDTEATTVEQTTTVVTEELVTAQEPTNTASENPLPAQEPALPSFRTLAEQLNATLGGPAKDAKEPSWWLKNFKHNANVLSYLQHLTIRPDSKPYSAGWTDAANGSMKTLPSKGKGSYENGYLARLMASIITANS
jgi:hypothetical protein